MQISLTCKDIPLLVAILKVELSVSFLRNDCLVPYLLTHVSVLPTASVF